MAGNDNDTSEVLNIRVPGTLAREIETVYEERGFTNKSEFIRTAIRDALNPPRKLSERALNDVAESESQIQRGETTSLDDLKSGTGSKEESDGAQPQTSVVERAVANSLDPEQAVFPSETKVDDTAKDILVIGVGGAGNNTLNRLHQIGKDGVETLAINTHKDHLEKVTADTKALIGKQISEGLGAGGDPAIGRQAAEEAKEMIRDMVQGVDLAFVVAGMGGGTGTGASPIIAQIAKEEGAVTVGVVSYPFNVERARQNKATEGIEELRSVSDTLIVLDNNRLLDYVPNLPIGKVFSVMDQLIAESIKSISETLLQPALINLDFADLKTVLAEGGLGQIVLGETMEVDDIKGIADNTLNHPLLGGFPESADSGIIQVTGGPELTVRQAEEIVEEIAGELPNARLIWGAKADEEMEGNVRILAVFAGINTVPFDDDSSPAEGEEVEGVELISSEVSTTLRRQDEGDFKSRQRNR